MFAPAPKVLRQGMPKDAEQHGQSVLFVLPSALSWGLLCAASITICDVFKILNSMIGRVVT